MGPQAPNNQLKGTYGEASVNNYAPASNEGVLSAGESHHSPPQTSNAEALWRARRDILEFSQSSSWFAANQAGVSIPPEAGPSHQERAWWVETTVGVRGSGQAWSVAWEADSLEATWLVATRRAAKAGIGEIAWSRDCQVGIRAQLKEETRYASSCSSTT